MADQRTTSRGRVMLALNHQEPDRVPIDLGATIVSSIAKQTYLELERYLGLPADEIKILDYVQQLPYVSEALMQRLAADFRMVQLPAATTSGVKIFEEGDYYAFFDRWGSKLHMPRTGGFYFDWVDFPIKEATMQALDTYRWPRPDPEEVNAQLGRLARQLYENSDYALVGSAVIGGGIFEQPARVMGLQNFLMALISEPAFADRLMETITDIYIESCNGYLDQVGRYIQVFTYWDDLAGQNGWLIRPELYRRLIKPKQKRLVEAIKRKTDAKLFYHSCGATRDLIPDLIEIGFDILNPVQVSARGMDTKALKSEFGRDIVFWGGGVDTQHILPFGKPQEVVDEVKRRIDDLAPGGGFVFAAVHNIQPLVPPENIVAAFDTALEYGRYGK
ncbi:MAG TPA: uroporphyrinogen decarboxylase family protein [Anaerolineales bacterium]|nr:uroporphyrinogen decarboxylase family protein [Anaerolineales bacterium]